VIPKILHSWAAPLYILIGIYDGVLVRKFFWKESTMNYFKDCFDSDTIRKITEEKFDEIEKLEKCYEKLMERIAELIIKTEVEMFRHKDKCGKSGKYTPEDLKAAMRFYCCILCSLNSFM
jgi:uncharacterized protein with ParB-like and HNH nuclease domain